MELTLTLTSPLHFLLSSLASLFSHLSSLIFTESIES